jgi:hypothetical protein
MGGNRCNARMAICVEMEPIFMPHASIRENRNPFKVD